MCKPFEFKHSYGRKNNTTVFGGDLRQILPVIPLQAKVQIVEACIQRSKIWNELIVLKLTKNMRVNASENEFCNWLLQLGNGNINCMVTEE